MGLVLNCQRCGGELPPMSEEDEKLFRAGKAVVLKHDVCPDQRAELAANTPKLRRFEARVSIVEVIAQEPAAAPSGLFVPGAGNAFGLANAPASSAPRDPEIIEIAGFTAWVDAANFNDGVRPLALALGERWTEMERHAPLADTPDLKDLEDRS